jgi:hypothetical protein
LPNANKDKRTPARPRESSELVSLLIIGAQIMIISLSKPKSNPVVFQTS